MTAQAAELGPERTPAKGGAQFQGSVANCSQSKLADGAEQRGFAAPWILDAIRPCFPMKMEAAFNRRMRANRMSGGVGGCRGAIPGIRPDLESVHNARREFENKVYIIHQIAAGGG